MAQLSERGRRFLTEGQRFAVLATINAAGTAQQTVMWYDIDGDEVLMNTALGRVKANNLQRDQRISICVEDGYDYVTITGTARLSDDQAAAHADIVRLARKYGGDPAQFTQQRRLSIRLPMERIIERLGD